MKKKRDWILEFWGVIATAVILSPYLTMNDVKTFWRVFVIPSLRDTWRILKGGRR